MKKPLRHSTLTFYVKQVNVQTYESLLHLHNKNNLIHYFAGHAFQDFAQNNAVLNNKCTKMAENLPGILSRLNFLYF